MGDPIGDDAVDAPLPQETNLEDLSLEKLYEYYSQANDLSRIVKSFAELKRRLQLTNLQGIELYRELRTKLKVWKAVELFELLEKRAKQKEYKQQAAAKGKKVLIIGAGPVGLRTAVDCVLLGCDVVVVEKRNAFTRNNVLHLWPFTIEDLRQLGAKKFFGKFCAGAIDHVSIRTLQCILLKICLLLGVAVYTEIEFVKILEPDQTLGWHASFKPTDHLVNQFDFDVLVGTDGKKSCIPGFDRKELRGKLALAITANFKNYGTSEEAACDEISGVAFIFNQQFFKDLKQDTGIDLENIVYYRDDTHYFVMTAKKDSLMNKGVIRADYSDTQQLLDRSNVDHEKLCLYAREAAEWSTDLPRLDFALNHYNVEDVFLFDFTSIHAAECSARAIRRNGKDLIMCLAGDSLLEPFWPIGTGCARGFLSAMDTAWMIQGLGQGKTIIELLCERESIYQRLPQTTPEKLHQSIKTYTIDPMSRYPNLNTQVVKANDVLWLYDTGNEPLPVLQPVPQKNAAKRYSMPVVGVSVPPVVAPAPVAKENAPVAKEKAKEIAKPVTKEPVGGATPSSPSDSLSPGRKSALEKGNVTRAYFGEDASSPALKDDKVLLKWLQDQLKEYKVPVKDLTDSWKDGMGLCALIHHYHPDLIPQYSELSPKNPLENTTLALSIAEEHFGFTSLLKPSDFSKPDKLAMLTYLSLYYEFFSTKEPVPLKVGRSDTFWKKLSRRVKKKKVTEDSAPSVERGWSTKTVRNQRKPSSSMSPVSELSTSGQTEEGSSSEPWRSPSPGEPEATAPKPEGTAPKKDKEASPQVESAKAEGKSKSKKEGKSSLKEAEALKKEEAPAGKEAAGKEAAGKEAKASKKEGKAEVPKKESPPPHVDTPSNPAPPVVAPAKDTPISQVAMARDKSTPSHAETSSRERPLSQIAGTAESSDYCYFCTKRVYLMERMSANGLFFHRNCFKCSHCKMQLGVGGYALSKGEGTEKGKFFCTAHYRQLFLSNPEAINYSRATPGVAPGVARPTPAAIPEEPHDVSVTEETSPQPQLQVPTAVAPERPQVVEKPVQPAGETGSAQLDRRAGRTASVAQPIQTLPADSQESHVKQQAQVALVETEGKSGQQSPRIKPTRVAPPPPSPSPNPKASEKAKEAPPLKATEKAVEAPPNQASPKAPQKPPPYGSSSRPNVQEMAERCSKRDDESRSSDYRGRAGSGLPPKTVVSPNRGKSRGRTAVARHLVNSPKDSDIEERQRMQRKVHQAQEIQLEMSQLDRQNEELEANSREVEEALRASEGTDGEAVLMKQWLALVNERNGLVRRTAELTVQWKELELEDQQYEIDKKISEVFAIENKTPADQSRFEELLAEKIKIVELRNDLIDQTEESRISELEEDEMHKNVMEKVVPDDSNLRRKSEDVPYYPGPYSLDKAKSKVRHSVA